MLINCGLTSSAQSNNFWRAAFCSPLMGENAWLIEKLLKYNRKGFDNQLSLGYINHSQGLGKMQRKKYYNKPTIYNGVTYDSKKEAKRAYELNMLQRAGKIKDLQRQYKFVLVPAFEHEGKTEKPITYVADFYYYDTESGVWIAEDTKGFRTDVYKIKRKLFLRTFPDIRFIES